MGESQQIIYGYTFEAFPSLPRAERLAILHRLPSTARIEALNEYIHRFNAKVDELNPRGIMRRATMNAWTPASLRIPMAR